MPNDTDYLSEEQARALWRRAAQLQAEAVDRREARTRLLATDGQRGEQAIHVSDVETAGIEAGIAPEFIQLARAETIAHGSKPMSPRWERVTDRFLGNNRRVIEISRTFDLRPRQVLDAMGRVFPANPYYLNVVDTLGDPAAGGVIIFDITRRSEASTSFSWDMLLSDIKQILVSVRPPERSADATDVHRFAFADGPRADRQGGGGLSTAFPTRPTTPPAVASGRRPRRGKSVILIEAPLDPTMTVRQDVRCKPNHPLSQEGPHAILSRQSPLLLWH